MQELKSCPFCGCSKVNVDRKADGVMKNRITHYCDGIYTFVRAKTGQEAINKWNKRVR